MAARIRKNDQVKVMVGRDRGKVGRVLAFTKEGQRVFVEKVNVVKRHTRPSAKKPQGGLVEKESSIHISNVALLEPKTGKATKVAFRVAKDGKKNRYSKKSGEAIETK